MHQLFDLKSILLYMEFVNEDPNLFMVLQLANYSYVLELFSVL